MRDSIMNGQDKSIMRESDDAEVGVREDCDEVWNAYVHNVQRRHGLAKVGEAAR